MHNVSNRPKQTQLFTRETSCYELGWVRVNPSFKKENQCQLRFQWLPRLLELFSKLCELPLQIGNFFAQTFEFIF
jgi:hypothetical protein